MTYDCTHSLQFHVVGDVCYHSNQHTNNLLNPAIFLPVVAAVAIHTEMSDKLTTFSSSNVLSTSMQSLVCSIPGTLIL